MLLASQKECTGCMACIDACRHEVLSLEMDKNGYYCIAKNLNKCIECGLCTKVCPIVSCTKQVLHNSLPFAFWNKNRSLRAISASGGAFSALAENVLKKGGVVYGAAISEFDIVHKRIDNLKDLSSLLGSKYQHSVTIGVYKQVRRDLLNGKLVLFSGMACQVAALITFLGKTKRDNLYTVDTICGGVSTILPMLHLKRSGLYQGIVSFRDKSEGWRSKGFRYALKMLRTDGEIENLGTENLVLKTFSSKLLKRHSCLDCHFTGHRHHSDCTIGDFWGDTLFKKEHPEGLSLMIINNDRIREILDENCSMRKVSWENAVEYNPNIYWTHYPFIGKLLLRKTLFILLRTDKFEKIISYLLQHNSVFQTGLKLYMRINTDNRKVALQKFIQTK